MGSSLSPSRRPVKSTSGNAPLLQVEERGSKALDDPPSSDSNPSLEPVWAYKYAVIAPLVVQYTLLLYLVRALYVHVGLTGTPIEISPGLLLNLYLDQY